MCNFLNDTKLSVMNSFTNNPHALFAGGVPTYVPKNGNVSEATCIDHFFGSKGVKCTPHSIAQCQELMHPQKAPDHYPISCSFCLDFGSSSSPLPRKKIGYDKKAFKDPAKCKIFESLVAKFPEVGIQVDNVSHCHIIQSNVYEALCSAFPLDKVKRQDYITDSTFRYICEASKMRKKKAKAFKCFNNSLHLWCCL